jgi:hypothetical protein
MINTKKMNVIVIKKEVKIPFVKRVLLEGARVEVIGKCENNDVVYTKVKVLYSPRSKDPKVAYAKIGDTYAITADSLK